MKYPRSSGKPKKPKHILVRRVSGNSMMPTLRPDRIVIGVRRYRALALGDVVVIEHHGLEKIKRIEQLDRDRLFVVGDNLAHSTDSRTFGWISVSTVIAKVIWPKSKRVP